MPSTRNKELYYIRYCWNGSKRQYEYTDVYESKSEWLFDIEGLPYDILDQNDHWCWVDYGDNDY